MKKIFLGILTGIIVLTVCGIVNASMMIPAADWAQEKSKAPGNSPVIGDNWDLERVDFIHYVKPANPAKPSKTESCYKLMGVKWADANLPVNYIINPTNQQYLDENFITSAMSISAETWDNEIAKELFNGSYATDVTIQYGVQDYKNAIAFGNYPRDGVIAVTTVWFTRVGKRIVEFDMLFDTDYVWGDAASDTIKMDLQNIATHELGHAIGLSDVYSDSCSYVTMYGYSGEGDIEKRSLEQSDITGLRIMYGI